MLQQGGARSFSPLAELLPGRTAPELAYLENKFAAMISYGLTAKLLAEVLPTGGNINVVFSHPQALQIILTSDDSKEFETSGEQNAIFEPLLGSQSVIGLSGDRHRRIRKLMMPPFHGERMRGMLRRNWRAILDAASFYLPWTAGSEKCPPSNHETGFQRRRGALEQLELRVSDVQ
jgi:cytochrome P450